MKSTMTKVTEVDEQETLSDDLPEGWAVALLGDISERIQYGYTASAAHVKGPRFLRITDIQNGKVSWDSVPSCDISDDDAEKYDLKPGDIVFARTGATTGKSFLISSCPPAVFASYLIRVRSHKLVIPSFLSLYFNTPQYWEFISDNVAGNAQPNCNASKLSALPVAIPPVLEQERIATKIDQLLKNVNASREHLAKLPKILKAFRQSVLAAACSGRLTEDWRESNESAETVNRLGNGQPPEEIELPTSWNWLLSLNAFDFVTSGSRGWARYYVGAGPIFLRVGNLNHDSIQLDLRSVQHVKPPANAEGVRTRVQRGDVLISITADVGMIGLVEGDIGETYINQHVALARPNNQMDRRYLAYFLAAKSGGQRQFESLQRGATKVGLGLDDIKSIWIARPPLAEQREIVSRVEGLFKLADTIEQRVEAATKRADKLTQAILGKAFRGELVPTEAELARRQGRDYEPASVLLDRIRAARQAETGKKNTSRRAPTKRRK